MGSIFIVREANGSIVIARSFSFTFSSFFILNCEFMDVHLHFQITFEITHLFYCNLFFRQVIVRT
ncbi:unnamed protein product [Schistosoma margrebowiei]|uniref:Uncharacterized protein n=1 Tax=Schistosoma margrebowiei TaxID=48269 RepID=A0A3P7Y1P1_9TREM|nr:unnamed protein product [Schistosoma margrebowiei]